MALAPGARLGPYEITVQIGAGGMGEVWRAIDRNLGRQVAVKVLPDTFAHDSERMARFEREATTLASLNHPNVATIYGLERSAGITALVMELVEGQTLAERIAQGLLALDEALLIARQVAEALEAAHAQGLVHRDLKPANIKVRPDGMVKVLDFGLAKAMKSVGTPSAGLSQAPTTAPTMTLTGIILGTAAYMSPEQAAGLKVDQRTDIWAFGVILYEMLTGHRLFRGDSAQQIRATVLEGTPSLAPLPATTPPSVRRLIGRCVERDLRRRLHHIADARIEIEDSLKGHDVEVVAARVVDNSAGLSSLQQQLGSWTQNLLGQLLAPFWKVGRLFAVLLLVPLVFVALGFLTSFTFNRALRLRSTEGLLDYMVFGYRAMIGPSVTLLTFIAGLALALAAIGILAWLGEVIWPRNRVLRLIKKRFSLTTQWLAEKDARTLGRHFGLLSAAAIAFYVAVSWKLLRVVLQLVASGPGANVSTSVLAPAERQYVVFVSVLGVATFLGLSALWFSLFSWLSRRGDDSSTVHLFKVRSLALILLLLLMVVAPWRLVWRNQHEPVSFDGRSGFILTEDGPVVILYFPGNPPFEVPRDDPRLTRQAQGTTRSIFAN